ncbi:TetR/AcrR family transcriptional regulator [Actinocorallia sp. API 0066]|uniref:TetR/AcrR family transcriptional regulator n=1 Tax=Actinocorallia sp. API 0066 TaxID=2896846 RepID=UPI001E64C19D|nr:TetR/AcrR family transcriptional regulator [Actinocorallia sp. API 0066]MCD0451653.1 TetR/AcrR family transcriptional regulator [Actinocorallia sp. API 0066]
MVVDAVERRVAEGGPGAVTVRGVAAETGVSNGAIYHAFGSLPGLLGRVWVRAASGFLDVLEAAVAGADTPVEAVVAAADAPARFAERRPAAARMLMTVDREKLLGPDAAEAVRADLATLDARLLALLKALARALWGRADAAGVGVVTLCVVDLPTAAFRRPLASPRPDHPAPGPGPGPGPDERGTEPPGAGEPEAGGPGAGGGSPISGDTRRRLEVAVRAVLALPPPGHAARESGTKDSTGTTGAKSSAGTHQEE